MAVQRRDAGEHHIGLGVLVGTPEEPEAPVGTHAPEGLSALAQDLLSVGDEQNPAEVGAIAVERGQQGLAQPGGHHHQSSAITLDASLLEGAKRLRLHRPRVDRLRGRLHDDRCFRGRGPRRLVRWSAQAVGSEPPSVDLRAAVVVPQALEALDQRAEATHSQVPLHSPVDARSAQVGAAHETASRGGERGSEQVGLGMERHRGIVERPDLEPARDVGHPRPIGEIEQGGESIGIGDVEVVGGENADMRPSLQGGLEVAGDERQTALHDERHRHVDPVDLGVDEPSQQLEAEPAVAEAVEQNGRALIRRRILRAAASLLAPGHHGRTLLSANPWGRRELSHLDASISACRTCICATVWPVSTTTTVRLGDQERELLAELAEEYGGQSGAIRRGIHLLAQQKRQREAIREFLDEWAEESGAPDSEDVAAMRRRYFPQ